MVEEANSAGVRSFVFTSSTSAFGRALSAGPGSPANWITEETVSIPRNIYGVTKTAAENLCELASSELDLPIVILRTARFFPEPDDLDEIRSEYVDENVKVNEYLYRRVDIEDAVAVHLLALAKAPSIGFAKYIVSATTPFCPSDVVELALDAPSSCDASSRTSRQNTPAVTGGCSLCSIVSMTTVGPEQSWTGHHAKAFETCLIA